MPSELERVTASQEEHLVALAGRLDAITGTSLEADVAAALVGETGASPKGDAQAAMIARLTALRLQIVRVALQVDAQDGTPRPIAGEISDDFEARRNHLPVIVHDRPTGDVEVLSEITDDDILRYVATAQHEALTSIGQMLDAIERARGTA